jgi:hypothetical protein
VDWKGYGKSRGRIAVLSHHSSEETEEYHEDPEPEYPESGRLAEQEAGTYVMIATVGTGL